MKAGTGLDRRGNMNKHTPGPWVMDGKHYRGKLDRHYHAITAGCGFHVTDDDEGFEITGCISTADARLIAAAPDLLEALERLQCAAYNIGGEHVTDHQQLIDAADFAAAAIAKAKGEQA